MDSIFNNFAKSQQMKIKIPELHRSMGSMLPEYSELDVDNTVVSMLPEYSELVVDNTVVSSTFNMT